MTLLCAELVRSMEALGVRIVSGVPCSILEPLQRACEASSNLRYVPACIEGEALSIASGAYLGGSLGAVFLQNSGLGNLINPLLSLCAPYQIPALMWISHRAQPGSTDAIHHVPMGEATEPLLAAMGIRYERFDPAHATAQVERALSCMREEQRPFALLVARGALGKVGPRPHQESHAQGAALDVPLRFGSELSVRPSRRVAFEALLPWLEDRRVISTTGFMSRELSSLGQFDRHFPMQGSMGFAPAIGLGVHCAEPKARICVLDGDGALLMHLGSLATIALARPDDLVHIVFDNQAYVSTGAQPSAAQVVDFAALALAAGYVAAADCRSQAGLADALSFLNAQRKRGPRLLRIAIDAFEADAAERPGLGPAAIAARFRHAATP